MLEDTHLLLSVDNSSEELQSTSKLFVTVTLSSKKKDGIFGGSEGSLHFIAVMHLLRVSRYW